ncbi:hypothetical protein O0I10_002274 [Lichtheimia ornata]|uniref:RING-type E3 ubiquitin transferase n=1 Tax=Lichtheimia ornata TaxID=688661 RepID=A0AAD7Y235_9FUNG|nr:uncharacterized protein O0I10_002274 [Lichtheimia ornata]KAJ8661943.1 hypothetical protein O0I10_002274 [Lichtheimia ornata]
MYDDDVRPASNLTQPSGSGLRGILYDRGKSCPSQQQQNTTTFFNNDYQHSIPRVALVKGGGPCTLVEKIKLAQQDGAQGVVAFSEEAPTSGNTFPGDYVNNEMHIPSEAGIAIPVYHIDPDMGIHLEHSIADLASKASPQQQQAIRVLLLPGNSHGPNPWELTLIIMIVLLGIGFITSVGMHFHLVRKNRILRQQVEAGLIPPPPDMLPMGKQLLDSDQLDKMPTRTIGGEQAAQEHRAVRRKASRISNASKIDTSAIHNKQQEDEDDDDEYTCVICLEKLEHGDTVRQLPCEHEYHCECIDPWLTSKSGECPLCKFDCVAALAPPSEQQPSKDENVSWTSRIKRLFIRRRQRQPDVEERSVELDSIELSSTATAAPATR